MRCHLVDCGMPATSSRNSLITCFLVIQLRSNLREHFAESEFLTVASICLLELVSRIRFLER
jgi:hypothetical protein